MAHGLLVSVFCCVAVVVITSLIGLGIAKIVIGKYFLFERCTAFQTHMSMTKPKNDVRPAKTDQHGHPPGLNSVLVVR